jgi:hypothetical protein
MSTVYTEEQTQQFMLLLVRGIVGVTPSKLETYYYPGAAALAVRVEIGDPERAVTKVDFWIENFHGLSFTPHCVVKQDTFDQWPPAPNVKILTASASRFSA